MPVFFTVDRKKTLHQGKVIELNHHDDISINDVQQILKSKALYDGNNPASDLQNHVNVLFPDGVSSHGDTYFLNSQSNTQLASPLIELIFEYVRRDAFSDKPSRFQSVFACDSLEQTKIFRDKFGDGAIWKLECKNSFRADMNLLTLGNQTSILTISYFAHRYWSGLSGIGVPPFWEYLLTPSIYVTAKVMD